MAVTMRDGAIIRKYTDKVDVLQAIVDIPANTSINVSYSPPAGYTAMIVDVPIGEQVFRYMTAKLYLDGTVLLSVISCGWISSSVTREEYPAWYAKHKIDVTLSNLDTVTHTTDFGILLFLIPDSLLDTVLKELRGDDVKEILIETRDIMKDVRDWMMKTLKK